LQKFFSNFTIRWDILLNTSQFTFKPDSTIRSCQYADKYYRECWSKRPKGDGLPIVTKSNQSICPFSGDICQKDVIRLEYTNSNLYHFGINSDSRMTMSHRVTCAPWKTEQFLIELNSSSTKEGSDMVSPAFARFGEFIQPTQEEFSDAFGTQLEPYRVTLNLPENLEEDKLYLLERMQLSIQNPGLPPYKMILFQSVEKWVIATWNLIPEFLTDDGHSFILSFEILDPTRAYGTGEAHSSRLTILYSLLTILVSIQILIMD
jgi:hypothetical protein